EIYEVGQLDEVLSGVDLDHVITRASSPLEADWNVAVSQQHHWQTLSALEANITGTPRAESRNIVRAIRAAEGLYAILEQAGVSFERFTGKAHLMPWRRAVSEFATRAGF